MLNSRLIILMIIVSLYGLTAFAQQSEGAKTAAKIELFHLPGLEPSRNTSSWQLDTVNFKPENFSFRIWNKKNLTDRLSIDVPMEEISCKPSWGMFVFRVNAKGIVDSTWYRGNLPPVTSGKILSNICATEGNWIIKPGTKPSHVAWFVYPFFDTRGLFPERSECSQADRELMQTVSSLSRLFFTLYFRVDRDYHRATMLRPTEIDGMPTF